MVNKNPLEWQYIILYTIAHSSDKESLLKKISKIKFDPFFNKILNFISKENHKIFSIDNLLREVGIREDYLLDFSINLKNVFFKEENSEKLPAHKIFSIFFNETHVFELDKVFSIIFEFEKLQTFEKLRKDINKITDINNISQEDLNKISKSFDLLENEKILNDVLTFREESNEFLDYLLEQESLANNAENGLIGLASGIYDLDEATGGLKKREYIVLAARPSMGKTSLALSFAAKIAEKAFELKEKKTVVMFSLEMDKNKIKSRMLALLTGLPLRNFIRGENITENLAKIKKAMEILSYINLIILDKPAITTLEMETKLNIVKIKYGEIDLTIADYIQLFKPAYRADRTIQIDEISKDLVKMSKKFDMPLIALSQLNRNLEQRPDKRPMLSDLRDSGAIEQDADIIFFLYKSEVYIIKSLEERIEKSKLENKDYLDLQSELDIIKQHPISVVDVIIAKSRNDSIGAIKSMFIKKTAGFTNYIEGEDIETLLEDVENSLIAEELKDNGLSQNEREVFVY